MNSKSARKNRERLAREQSLVPRSPEAPLKMVLCYPGRYSVAMANLGFQRVFELFNRSEGVYCDRAFFPDPQELREHFDKRIPITGIESQKPLSAFDVVAFSFAFELDYVPALEMLWFSRIPLRSGERQKTSGRKTGFPLLMAGGIAISANPEPMAEFMDLVVIGEAEPVIAPLLESLRGRTFRAGCEELREKLSRIPSVYVPSAYQLEYDDSGVLRSRVALAPASETIKRAAASEDELPAWQRIFSPEMEFSELGLIELMRGCRRGCRFCLEGYFYRPVREAKLKAVLAGISELRRFRNKLGLIAPLVPDYGQFRELLLHLAGEDIPFSVSSLRMESLSEPLLALLKKSGNRTITLAPETGSLRLKCLVNKEMSEERVLQGIKLVGQCRFERVKLYYQAGFPEESLSEIDALVDSVYELQNALASGAGLKKYPGVVEVCVNPFVPKAWTAFQWLAVEPRAGLEQKFNRLREKLGREPGLVLKLGSVREAVLQAVLSRGDRRAGSIIEDLALGRRSLNQVLRDEKICRFYLRSRGLEEMLPWDFIRPGVKKSWLRSELEKAVMGKISPGCRHGCRECGAC